MEFKIGDHVNKLTGYKFPGTVVAVFQTKIGNTRLVIEMDGYGLLHIFNPEQVYLEPSAPQTNQDA